MSHDSPIVYGAIRDAVEVCLNEGMTHEEARLEFMREWIRQGMEQAGNNQCVFASMEGVHRNTIARMMLRAGFDPEKTWKKTKLSTSSIREDTPNSSHGAGPE